MKILPVGAELFHADGRTDMKLIVAFHNFANAPAKEIRRTSSAAFCYCRIPSIPFTQPCTVCRINFVPHMVCIFGGQHIYFRSRFFFLLLCLLSTKCRKRTYVGVTLSVRTSELITVNCTVQDASTKNCRRNFIFVHIGPV